MPSKQAVKFMKLIKRRETITRRECAAAEKEQLLDDLLDSGYIECAERKYLDSNFNAVSLSLGADAKFRLADKGYEYLELQIDRKIDRWFTRSISVLAFLISLVSLLLTWLK